MSQKLDDLRTRSEHTVSHPVVLKIDSTHGLYTLRRQMPTKVASSVLFVQQLGGPAWGVMEFLSDR